MKEILERISLFKYITVVVFEEEIIFNIKGFKDSFLHSSKLN